MWTSAREKKMCNKKAHLSRFAAENQIRIDIKEGLYEEGDKHSYNCPYCNKWHVGADRGINFEE